MAVNPKGGSYDAFLAYEKMQLSQWPGEYDIVYTSLDRHQTAADIAEMVKDDPTAVIVTHTGDGGHRDVALGVIDNNLPNPVVAEWGGTKCDTAHALRGRTSILDVIAKGIEMEVPVLSTQYVTPEDKKFVVESVDNVGFMSPVAVMKAVDAKKARNKERSYFARYASEASTTIDAIANHPTFIALFPDGRKVSLATLMIAHNEFMAGDGKMHVTKADWFTRVIAVGSENAAMTGLRMTGLASGIYRGKRQFGPLRFKVLPDIREDNPILSTVPFLVDGEYQENEQDLELPMESEVTVDLNFKRTYTTITTSPKMIRRAAEHRRAATLLGLAA